MKELSHDVVESILERVPVNSLLRFKAVSKQWKSTIESKNFQERQLLIHRQQSPGLDVLFVTYREPNYDYYSDDIKGIPSSSSLLSYYIVDGSNEDYHTKIISSSIKVNIKRWFSWSNSCDGLLCFCNEHDNIIINPTTRWLRTFPLSSFQKQHSFRSGWLGFGKDKFSGTYKLVWLYNNTLILEFDSKKTKTTCEVFDFGNNAWRYVTCHRSPYDIIEHVGPMYVEGSLHWLTKCEELDIQVLSFDLHTETFQVTAKAPFAHADYTMYEMCNQNNGLCIAKTNRPNQVIWLFDTASKTWKHMCSIDLDITYSWFKKTTKYEEQGIFDYYICSLKPIAVLEEGNEKTKVLFYFRTFEKSFTYFSTYFVIYDVQTDSFDIALRLKSLKDYPVCYFQSLISNL